MVGDTPRVDQRYARASRVAFLGVLLALPFVLPAHAATSCPALAGWIDSALDDSRVPVRRAATAWSGSEALIWGGEIGYGFDPATSSWRVLSGVGAPGGYAPLYAWTGSELLIWGGTLSASTTAVDTSGGRYDPVGDAWSTISTIDAPSGRRDAASAWTGTEWVVWGGRAEDGTPLGDGAVYDPSGDGWTAASGTDAPSARYGHSMTWTQGAVLLFGGRSGGTYHGDLYAYDPAGDVWSTLTAPPGEAGRSGHVAIWTGTYLVIYGGQQSGSGVVNTGWRYRLSDGQWTAMSTAGAPAAGTTTRVTWTGSELIVWSGEGTAAGRYDPQTNSWSAVTTTGAPEARGDHSVEWLGDRLLVWGGGRADGGTYDPLLDQWTPTDPALPTRPMRNHTALWTGSEVLFWGGQVAADHALASGYRYDPASDSWDAITTVGAPSARRFHTAVWTGTEMIVWGGQDPAASSTRYDDGARYDPASDSWFPLATLGAPAARTHHNAVWTGSKMIVWGGWIGTARDVTNTGAAYDPATDSWTPISTVGAPDGSRDAQVVWTGSRMIVWSGGVDQPDTTVAYATTGAAYDPLTDTWSPIANAATAGLAGRMQAAAVWSGDELLVWGGAGDPDTLATGGRYDPAGDSWTAMSQVDAPGDRRKAVGVWTGDALLVYGGVRGDWKSNSAHLDDGGFYLPASDRWIPLPVDLALGPRSLHAGVWTGDRLVAFGGQSDGGDHNKGGVLLVGRDDDADAVCDSVDNCLALANSDQADLDADGVGDACDVCPATPDPDQLDGDADGTGDACSWCSDPDGDGACDQPAATAGDRCPLAFNPSGRKIVISGDPFDGREVTQSYLRRAGDDAALVVYDGDLAVDGTQDLFTQRPLESLQLTSLGASAIPFGYTVEGIYDDVALMFDQQLPAGLYGTALEAGTLRQVDPLPAGYEISRRGTKIIYPWTLGNLYPCDDIVDPAFALIDTATGLPNCYGVNQADQTIADWELTPDRSWVIYSFHDFNSLYGSYLNARNLDSTAGGTLDASTETGGWSVVPTVPVRDDGLALAYATSPQWPDYFYDVRTLRVGSTIKTVLTGYEVGPAEVGFGDRGDGLLILAPDYDGVDFYQDLHAGLLTQDGSTLIESHSVDHLDAVRFAPGEAHVAFTDGTALHVTPTVAGGPVSLVATAGNTIAEFGFTPDGSTLLYAEERGGDLARELWAVPVTGGTPARIGPIPDSGRSGVAEWTFVEGRLIVLGSFHDPGERLWSMNVDGSDVRPILAAPDSVVDYWTGFDGGIVLRGDASTQLLLAAPDGGLTVPLTTPGIEDDPSDPQIADDGSLLIYDARIAGGDRETVLLLEQLPDQDADGILDPCDCLPADPAAGQSPGLPTIVFTDDVTIDWEPDGVSTGWTIYRGDLTLLPGDAGSCLIEGHPVTEYMDGLVPAAGEVQTYLVAGEAACGKGEVAPASDGAMRNVSCP